MTYYFRVKSKGGRCGCSSVDWKKSDRFDTKASLKKEYKLRNSRAIVEIIMTEEQLAETTYKESVMKEARAW